MGKRGSSRKKDKNRSPMRRDDYVAGRDMDDEIDSFHKQRDMIPLDINYDAGDSDEDNELPVIDVEGIYNDEEDSDNGNDNDDEHVNGLAAKIARQQKYLRAKMGGVDDEMHNDAEDGEERKVAWGGRKNIYYSADNVDFELQSSDEELPAEEEAEVLRLQREKAKSLSIEDFGLEDADGDESEGEPTLEEIRVNENNKMKWPYKKEAKEEADTPYEVKKDLQALSKEEQMDVVHSSAPELVGLLSDLNDALEDLDNKVSPLLRKVKEVRSMGKGGMHYIEVKKLLLLSYCQAITFYLILKSEGQPIRDHPVIARVLEIKNLLDKMKQLDENLPSDFYDILSGAHAVDTVTELVREDVLAKSASLTRGVKASWRGIKTLEAEVPLLPKAILHKVDSHGDSHNKRKQKQIIRQDGARISTKSVEMFNVRAALEEKLKQKGIFNSVKEKPARDPKNRHYLVNGQLETLEDYIDDDTEMEIGKDGISRQHLGLIQPKKLSHLVAIAKANKPKIISGDDDLPKRDDIGERRRKHELQVLAGAGIKSEDDVGVELFPTSEDKDVIMEEQGESDESEDEFYKQVKEERAAKLAAKAEIYSRTSIVPNSAENLVVGKRQITYQMEKNRGLTRARKKLIKNPRKNYKVKHKKAIERRKGQVRDIKKPSGPYVGESTGINVGISRSIRFKS